MASGWLACPKSSALAQHPPSDDERSTFSEEYQHMSIRVCGDTSAREHTDNLPLLEYLDSLVHLYKPVKALGFAVLALRHRVLQSFQNPEIW